MEKEKETETATATAMEAAQIGFMLLGVAECSLLSFCCLFFATLRSSILATLAESGIGVTSQLVRQKFP